MCTGCGTVLESGIIVSDVQVSNTLILQSWFKFWPMSMLQSLSLSFQFEENAHGGSSAIGTFVSADRKGGGGNNFGGNW